MVYFYKILYVLTDSSSECKNFHYLIIIKSNNKFFGKYHILFSTLSFHHIFFHCISVYFPIFGEHVTNIFCLFKLKLIYDANLLNLHKPFVNLDTWLYFLYFEILLQARTW